MNQLAYPRDTTTKATSQQISQALLLLTSLPYRREDDGDVKHKAFQIALKGVTRYALSEAVTAVLQGSLGHAFYPSPPELRLECVRMQNRVLAAERRARLEHEQLAEAAARKAMFENRTPEEKARVAQMVADFQANVPKQKTGS